MEKAIEIKRRAQRAILNGDLNSALSEYEKLVAIGDPDPYYCVLLADLLYKMGSAEEAQKRYLEAIEGYAKSSLFKNGIAVCKKLARLSLAPIDVPRWLAKLYSLDGLGTEAGLAYQQLSEVLVKSERIDEARAAILQAIQVSPEASRLYERLGEIEVLAGNNQAAGDAWSDAAERFERGGQEPDVRRCRSRIAQLQLTSPPTGNAPLAKPPGTPNPDGPKTLVWEAAGAGSADAPSLSISHGPPSPDGIAGPEAAEEVAKEFGEPTEVSRAVTVERGFDGLATSQRQDAEAVDDYDASDDDEANGEVAGEDLGGEAEVLGEAFTVVPGVDPAHDAAADAGVAAEAAAEATADAWVATEAEAFGAAQAQAESEHHDLDALQLSTPSAATTAGESLSLAGLNPLEYASDDAADEARGEAEEEAEVLATGLGQPFELPAPWTIREIIPPPALLALPTREPVIAAVPAIMPAPIMAPAQGLGIQRFTDSGAADAPGLRERGRGEVGGPTAANERAFGGVEAGASPEEADLAHVSLILAEAQTCFHAGDREAATMALIRAAQAYDQMGRYDSAVAIYRSLGQSSDVSLQLMMLWLKNCQRRDDREEASRVACDLGERALNDHDVPGAKDWFERARSYDASNELASRRLSAIETAMSARTDIVEQLPAAKSRVTASVPGAAGHLNVRTNRDEPVLVDLGTLIEEFQRAIEPELASDPQGHYDLGMSYREMGLTEQAVTSLRVAAQSPLFLLRAGELGGRCLLDLGRFDEAADLLRSTLVAPDLLPSAAVDLRYQLALALEAAGRSGEALIEFERVYASQANYPDVAMKIRLLRKTAEAA